MRLLVLVIAIVLLPLRGWLGDAMMIAPVQQATAGHAMHATAGDAMDAHAMHSTESHAVHAAVEAVVTHDGGDSAHAAHATHTTCDTCQFCHSVAVTAWPEVPMPAGMPAHAPIAEAMRFASAEAAQGFKPPIS